MSDSTRPATRIVVPPGRRDDEIGQCQDSIIMSYEANDSRYYPACWAKDCEPHCIPIQNRWRVFLSTIADPRNRAGASLVARLNLDHAETAPRQIG